MWNAVNSTSKQPKFGRGIKIFIDSIKILTLLKNKEINNYQQKQKSAYRNLTSPTPKLIKENKI